MIAAHLRGSYVGDICTSNRPADWPSVYPKAFLVYTLFLQEPEQEPEAEGHTYIPNVIPEYGCAARRHKRR